MSILPNKHDAPSLHALLEHELKDLYDGEHQIIEALPLMIEQATHPELQKAFRTHLEETKKQVTKLEQCFKIMQVEPERVTCDGMKGIIKEGQHVLKADMDPAVKDDALIGAAQRVEHYEMAGYGCARNHAKHLGYNDMAELLDEILDEEGATDKILTKVAENLHKELAAV
jgi:ferritin-like metal-binding protein YciE